MTFPVAKHARPRTGPGQNRDETMHTTDPSQKASVDTAALRRRQPRPGDLADEIRTLLAAAGLSCADLLEVGSPLFSDQ